MDVEEHEIEQILDSRQSKNTIEYLINCFRNGDKHSEQHLATEDKVSLKKSLTRVRACHSSDSQGLAKR